MPFQVVDLSGPYRFLVGLGRFMVWCLTCVAIWLLYRVTHLGDGFPHLWLVFAATQLIWLGREMVQLYTDALRAPLLLRLIIQYSAGLFGSLGYRQVADNGGAWPMVIAGLIVFVVFLVARWADEHVDQAWNVD